MLLPSCRGQSQDWNSEPWDAVGLPGKEAAPSGHRRDLWVLYFMTLCSWGPERSSGQWQVGCFQGWEEGGPGPRHRVALPPTPSSVKGSGLGGLGPERQPGLRDPGMPL